MTHSGLPVVAIVGRPNVGKSTLFNRLVGERQAIVEDRAGTTRDRIYGESDWNGRAFVVVDTGGLEEEPGSDIELRVQEQARLAIAEADVIVLVVDAGGGLTAGDQEAAELLRRAQAPIIVAANKADSAARELAAADAFRLGWSETYPISAAHGRGTGDLLDAIVAALPPRSEEELARLAREEREAELAETMAEDLAAGIAGTDEVAAGLSDEEWAAAQLGPVTVALVGRPNVGKSSLLNALLGEERAIVSPLPGTTRDAIDTRLAWGQGELVLVDTAGIRRRGKVASAPDAERFSALRSLRAIARADVAVLLLDATAGLTAQDAHIAGYVVEQGRGLVIAINKWDLLAEKTGKSFDRYVARLRADAPFLDFAPVVSISAKTGQRVEKVLELAVDVWGERRKRISTAELNRLVREAIGRQTPPEVKGHRPKLFYATQVGIAPPTFVFFARDAAHIHFSYARYLENRIRDLSGFHGTPIRMVFRERASAGREERGRDPRAASAPRRPPTPSVRRRKASAGPGRPRGSGPGARRRRAR